MKIAEIKAQEVLDSRGNPTVMATVILDNGARGNAIVPSGASTGKYEALELRDDDARYHGKGVLKAIGNIQEKLKPALRGMLATNQQQVDYEIIQLDGTKNKRVLGANALLAVSIANCKAAAASRDIPLYQHIHNLMLSTEKKFRMPIPMMNLINGGRHAEGSSDLQEYMILPVGAKTFAEAIRMGSEIFHSLKDILHSNGLMTTVGDEGGFAFPMSNNRQPLDLMMQAIEKAGYRAGDQVVLGIDCAASEFFKDGQYHLKTESRSLSSSELLDYYRDLIANYPIRLIEDGFDQDDWKGFVDMTRELGKEVYVVGDDLFVTNVDRIKRGIFDKAANSIIIKPNQIGTVTEVLEAIKLSRSTNITPIASHRSGETEDTFIADLAVGMHAKFIKTGSLSRSERIAKYNRLMQIEQELGEDCFYSEFTL